ncbi:MAG TPA: radical SAM protein [Patescibacteria group bacterium]|nr:radical SAM protein [Patescibacteria group bacterium]
MREATVSIPALTKRIDLNVGYSCNMKCRFCYYLNDVKARSRDKDLSTQECKRLIVYYRRKGMEVLEFTGGEPTIRPDLCELAQFAGQAGFRRISIITNGVRLADAEYAQRLVASGVKDFLFSLHGSKPQTHDFVTCLPSSYDRLIHAIRNLIKLGVRVRCNSVVTGSTLEDIYARARLFKELEVQTVNFIMFNPIEQAVCAQEENFFRYSQVVSHLNAVIDDFAGAFKKLTFRYIPLCLMKGHENHVQNVHQVHYDHDEWDYYLRTRIRQPYWVWCGAMAVGSALLPGKRQWSAWGPDHLRHAAILEAHSWLHKHKFPQCRRCSYGFICGGVWKQYARRFGGDELVAQEGSLILPPWHFMTDNQRAA